MDFGERLGRDVPPRRPERAARGRVVDRINRKTRPARPPHWPGYGLRAQSSRLPSAAPTASQDRGPRKGLWTRAKIGILANEAVRGER
jgi:hypothetical protein